MFCEPPESNSVSAVTRLQVSSPDFRPLMLTVFLAIRIARPCGQSVAVGLRLRILRLSSPSCHTFVPQDLFIYPLVFCLPPLFPWRLSSQSCAARYFRARFVFSALPVAATPCGSRYSLSTTQVRGTYAAEAVLLGVGPRRLAAVGQRFLFSPSNRVDHFALADSFGLSGFICQTSFAFFASPMPLPTLGRCRYQDLQSAFAATRLRQTGYATFVPFTSR